MTATVLLLGNPNVGKSTLFNALTGARQEVRNAPGTTVEVHEGQWAGPGVRLLDVPGTYSLLARSPDEQVAVDVLAGAGADAADLVVVLLDAAALPRSLYLLGQVAQAGRPVVAALTMCDVAAVAGARVDPAQLQNVLGVPVVATDPRRRDGLAALAAAVTAALRAPAHVRGLEPDPAAPGFAPCGCPTETACTHPCAGPGPAEPLTHLPLDTQLARSQRLFDWVQGVLDRAGPAQPEPRPTVSDRIDRVLLHPVAGVPILLVVAWTLFQLATAVAAPLMDWAERLVSGPLTAATGGLLDAVGAGGGWLEGLVVGGVLAGVGTVLSFVPLMSLMFLAIALLEDSGYLARAAFVADRAMRHLGLDGRAVLPLVVGFGCNLPALAATRTLPDARQRLITTLLVPYTSCAARLTVYILLAAAFFPDYAGTVIFAMYLLSVLLIAVAGRLLSRFIGAGGAEHPLVLVLPAYQRPRLGALLTDTWRRLRSFVTKAGKVIVAALTVVWVLLAVPVTGGHPIGEVPVTDSLYGATAEAITPVFAPAGFDDWRATAALMTGFVAKEVVVGSFAQTFAVTEPDDPADAGPLTTRLRAALETSSDGHGEAAALAFMVFVLAYTPCLATLAEQRRLIGRRRTAAAIAVQLTLAWCAAVATFQIGQLLW
ncbi:ferrous iron transport protein B [Georgenia yuyongxinii]|nr:ferrous iron transport protein B [Georgenia yuyongxinii]